MLYFFEVYCVHAGRHECGVCDAADPHKAHPIGAAIDGEETNWQSPSLQNGPEFHYVTITVDLKEVGKEMDSKFASFIRQIQISQNAMPFIAIYTVGRPLIHNVL